jgi:hypothetical protein
MSAIGKFICWFDSIEWTPEAVTAAGTIALAFLTLILAAGTLFLWCATRRLVIGAEKTAEQQLRAYVHVSAINISRARSLSKNWTIQASWNNFGDTPTRDFAACTNNEVINITDIANFAFTDRPDAQKFFGLIGPSQSVNPPPIDFDNGALREASMESRAFLIWGHAEYHDVFRKTPMRKTEFGFRVMVKGNPESSACLIWFEPTEKHNEAT